MAIDDILVITRRNQRPRNNSQQRIDGYSTTLSGSTNGIIREGQLYLSSLPVQSGFKMKRFLFFDRPSAARLSIIERSTHRFTFLPLFTFQPWITLFRRQNNVTGLNFPFEIRVVSFYQGKKILSFLKKQAREVFSPINQNRDRFLSQKIFFPWKFYATHMFPR